MHLQILLFTKPTKNNLFLKFFCLLLFEGTFTSHFKGKKSSRSRKTVEIKICLTIFVWWWRDPDPYLWLKDPGGPKPTHQRRGGTHSPGGEGDGGSIFWKTPAMGLASYSYLLLPLTLTYTLRLPPTDPEHSPRWQSITWRTFQIRQQWSIVLPLTSLLQIYKYVRQRLSNDLKNTRFSRRHMMWLLAHPLPRQQVVSLSPSSCVSPVQLTCVTGGGAKIIPPAKKPGLHIQYHSILSALHCMKGIARPFELRLQTWLIRSVMVN